jgi:hypothetical protein
MTMTYSILDSTGNLVDAFDDHDAAVAALTAIVTAEPDAADDVAGLASSSVGWSPTRFRRQSEPRIGRRIVRTSRGLPDP